MCCARLVEKIWNSTHARPMRPCAKKRPSTETPRTLLELGQISTGVSPANKYFSSSTFPRLPFLPFHGGHGLPTVSKYPIWSARALPYPPAATATMPYSKNRFSTGSMLPNTTTKQTRSPTNLSAFFEGASSLFLRFLYRGSSTNDRMGRNHERLSGVEHIMASPSTSLPRGSVGLSRELAVYGKSPQQ